MGANDLLVFKAPEVRQRMTSLLERIDEDTGLRDFFLRDPAGVIRKTVFPDEHVVAAEINRGNRLLYSLLSNQRFLDWAAQYEKDLAAAAIEATQIEDPETALRTYLAVVDRTKVHQDLVAAVADFSDPELIAAFTWKPDIPHRAPAAGTFMPQASVAVDIEVFIYAVVAVAVFAVAVAALGVKPSLDDSIVSRIDLQAAAQQLADALGERAHEVRDSGVLTQVSQRNLGYTR